MDSMRNIQNWKVTWGEKKALYEEVVVPKETYVRSGILWYNEEGEKEARRYGSEISTDYVQQYNKRGTSRFKSTVGQG